MSPPEAVLSLRSLPDLLRRYRAKMAVFAVVVMGVTVAFTAFGPRTYRSEAKLLIRLGRENTTVDATATLGQTSVVSIPTARENEINSILEELTSRNLIVRVVDSVGPEAILGTAAPKEQPPHTASDSTAEADPPPPTQIDDRYRAIVELTKSLKVEAVKRSNILVVSCDAGRPETAQAVVARLVDFSLDRHMSISRAQGAFRLLAQQADLLDKRLRNTEEELSALKSKTGLVSPDGQRDILAKRIGRLDDEFLQTSANLHSTQAEVQSLEKELAGLPHTHVTAAQRGVTNTAADQMRAQLYTLQLKEMELLARHAENHPEVKLIRRQTAAAKELLAREEATRELTTTGPSRVHEELHQLLVRQQTQLVALRMRKEIVEKQLEHERDALKTFLADEVRIARLQRRMELESSHLRKYAESLEQGRIDQALQSERISNISLVQSATCDPKPVRPRWSINLGFGLLLALTGSGGLAVLLEYRRNLPSAEESAMRRLANTDLARPQDGLGSPRDTPPRSQPAASPGPFPGFQ